MFNWQGLLKYEIVELEQFSGAKATIYSILPYGEKLTLFEGFLNCYKDTYFNEIVDIIKRLKAIGYATGAREQFFKLHESRPGENIAALYDKPGKFLRLYCIWFNNDVIILGGGGPKTTQTWQEDLNLYYTVNKLRKYSNDIYKRIDFGDIYWSKNRKELEGNLNMDDNEEI